MVSVTYRPTQKAGIAAAYAALKSGERGYPLWHDLDYRRRLAIRMWQKVDLSDVDGCWPWMAARTRKDDKGYGVIGVGNKRDGICRVSRLMWALYVGPIPDDIDVLHGCDNPPCVKLPHLRLGTALDNSRDSILRGTYSPPPHYSGEKNPAAKLKLEDIPVIRLRVLNGDTLADIGRDYGVHYSTIGLIRDRKKWAHVP